MDDFGSILERDYGLGRSGKGRIGSRNSGRMDSNFDSTRFSDSFGRNKFRGEFNFRGGSNLSSNWNNSGYGAYAAYPGSYTVYDEVFSCNMQSTIPFFEDVFRVPSSRMKVSELRDNDILRGIPGSLRKSSSKITYEDIFGEAPDEFSGPFLSSDLAGSRLTTTSSRTSSSGRQSPGYFGTPRKETTEASKLHSESSKSPPLPAQQQMAQGSFLAMSGNLEEKGSLKNDGNWLCVGEVSLTTAPSENPPLRLAPSRQDSGPPPSRPPPPRLNEEVEQARLGEPSPCSSELLESVLRERNAHAEISIRDKVLDWHKHNMQAEQEQQKERGGDKVASDPQNSSRSQVLDRLRTERSAIERMAAEVEETAAEQAKLRAERAVLEDMERHARAMLMKQPDNGALQNDSQPHAQASAETEAEAGGKATKSNVEPQDTASDQDTDKIKNASEIEGDSRVDGLHGRKTVDDSQKLTGAPSTHDVQATTTDCNAAVELEDKQASASDIRRDYTEEEARKEEISTPVIPAAAIISESESTVSIDTISSSEESTAQTTSENDVTARGGGKEEKEEEEAAPETPERLETTTHARHEKNNKSSELSPEEAIESAWKEEIKKTQQQQQQEQKQQKQQEPQREQEQKQVGRERAREEARKAAERSLVARITAEVRERAAVEAKARAEKAATLEKKDDRRTKPRLKEETSELVAKEREDTRAAGPSKGSSNGMMRVSLREQLEKERIARLENEKKQLQQQNNNSNDAVQAKLRAERSLAERITAEVRERAASARAEKAEKEREAKEKERLERLDKARERERERLERLERERERERERLEREQEREREIEREKDRVSLEEKAAKEREAAERKAAEEQQQQRLRMERAAVERATAEARARAERAAYERAASTTTSSTTTTASRPTSVPKQRFGNSMSMPSTGTQPMENGNGNGNMRRATSSTSLDSDRYASAEHEFQDQFKGETPERRKARLERYQRTQNRAAQALAQKNKRDLELQSEQAERQRLSERLDGEIKRWSAGKDGNIRALLSTLQYVLWPESGWKQVSLTELISPAAVKKAYRRATLCVHPDKMQQKHASVQHKYIAEKVFHILQVAWNKFNSQETL